jgi:hypothetical protein
VPIRPLLVLVLVLGAACDAAPAHTEHADAGSDAAHSDSGDALRVGPPESAYAEPPSELSAWNLFEDLGAQRPGPRTLPYDVIAPLFSDYTAKRRFVYVPAGKAIAYDPTELWQLPPGSVLVKTFSYPQDERAPEQGERLLETRLLVFKEGEVVAHTYVWNEAQTDATRKVAGARISATWIDASGDTRRNDYTVPNANKCFDCHGERGETDALGLRTRQLDRAFA